MSRARCRTRTGPLHLGHIVEHVQSDIYVRFQPTPRPRRHLRVRGRYARHADRGERAQEGVDPADDGRAFRQEHNRDLRAFDISSTSTTRPTRRRTGSTRERVYAALRAGGHVVEKRVEQFYLRDRQRFLPDRFVKGTCPFCGTADQYGDVCENCKKTYRPIELKAPYLRDLPERAGAAESSTQIFVRLSDFTDFLREFSARLQPEVRNYVSTWIEAGARGLGHLPRRSLLRLPDSGRRRTSTSTSGWTLPSGTSRRRRRLAKERGFDLAQVLARDDRQAGARTSARRSCTSSARTSSTSTRSSGRRC